MPKAIKRRRRKGRKSRYKTGVHHSTKSSKPIEYRSGWELTVCQYLDHSLDVLSYEYEAVRIPYISNLKTGKIRGYYPDFLITFINGTRLLVEVKRRDKVGTPLVMKKSEAGRLWAENQTPKIQFALWTNKHIEAFRKINEVRSRAA